jgi:uncharacterized membrane protein YphA (DoxX/SURF4 family)
MTAFIDTWRARLDAFPQSLLFTRFATLPLMAMTITIQCLVYWADYPSHLLWFAILVFILVRGPGPLSLDALIFGKRA